MFSIVWAIMILLVMSYADYYIGLLSAAEFYGVAHQKPMVFQVVIPSPIFK
jgi:hypothetical protein